MQYFFTMFVPISLKTEDFISVERMEAASQALLSKGKEKSALGEMATLLENEDTADSKTVREPVEPQKRDWEFSSEDGVNSRPRKQTLRTQSILRHNPRLDKR
mmetsp:Transcript_33181/g.65719  ORF Transcript_33181/g.65719 Transcript_33181/m.65719 type:complete len:103 (+) Transcript_33181:283-591(+)